MFMEDGVASKRCPMMAGAPLCIAHQCMWWKWAVLFVVPRENGRIDEELLICVSEADASRHVQAVLDEPGVRATIGGVCGAVE